MARIAGLADVQPAPLECIPQANVTVRIAAARQYGLTPGDVRRGAAIMMAGEPMSVIAAGGKLYVVAAWTTAATRNSLTSLEQLPVNTPDGGHVSLGTVASIAMVPSPSQIIRDNGERMQEVDADVEGRDLGSAAGAVQAALATLKLPAGSTAQLEGEAVERAPAKRRLIYYGVAAGLATLLRLQAAFGSWRLTFMLIITLPMALVGGVLAAWGDLGTITLGALVGFFTVLGIAARNGNLLIAHFRHLEEQERVPFSPGMVLRGASERLSPILMTALVTALALAPLVIYHNKPGQEIEYPMAVVILGGLATSTLLNLFALYLRVAGLAKIFIPNVPVVTRAVRSTSVRVSRPSGADRRRTSSLSFLCSHARVTGRLAPRMIAETSFLTEDPRALRTRIFRDPETAVPASCCYQPEWPWSARRS